MSKTKTAIAIVLFIFLMLFFASVFTIPQGHHGILLRLGRLMDDPATGNVRVLEPGLHFKWPFIESVRVFDTRIQTLDIKSSRIVTKEKKDVIADYYVKWRISDLAQYFKSTGGNEFKAESLLEQQLNTLIRSEFGKRTIKELVSNARGDIMKDLQLGAEEEAAKLGIEVVDVRIKGIELPASTSNAIFKRMRADMQKIANSHRASGKAKAEKIQATADKKVTVILAEAKSDGQLVRAEGQATAAQIYANAFSQNKEFFEFYRSLVAYEESFTDKQDILVLDQSSEFFQFFKHSLKNNSEMTGN